MSTSGNSIVIVRAPLRVSFVGGGSDLPVYSSGSTISTAINRYVYCVAKWRFDGRVYLSWSEKEVCSTASELRHELAREALLYAGIHTGIELLTFADVPGVGSGLGSSAATTVAILKALFALKGSHPSNEWIAERAADIELGRLKKKGGRQDQYASACGGFLRLDYVAGRVEKMKRLPLQRWQAQMLEDYFVLFSPSGGDGRDANAILDTAKGLPGFGDSCCALCDKFEVTLMAGDYELLGDMIFQHHRMKAKEFGGYMNSKLESMSFAPGWKLCGAGGTGHLLVTTTPECRAGCVGLGEKLWGPELPFGFSLVGAEVIYRA